MKRVPWIGGLGATFLLLSACSSVSYVSDWDTQKDFSGYQTFAWYELAATPDRGAPPAAPNAIVADRIRRSVQGELGGKGLTAEAAAEADLLVTYHIAIRQGMRVYNSGWGHPYRGCWGWGGYGYGWGGGYGSARLVTEGTLIVDVLDGKTRRLVWRGIAEGAFKKPNPSDDQVAKIVTRVLTDFPPA